MTFRTVPKAFKEKDHKQIKQIKLETNSVYRIGFGGLIKVDEKTKQI